MEVFRVFALLWSTSAAAFFAGTIVGFLFGLPKSESSREATVVPSPIDNTNLQEVSDWLTKIIVGVGLVEFGQITAWVVDIGSAIGLTVGESTGGREIAIAGLIYGFVCGFLYYYLWARLWLFDLLKKRTERNQ